MQRDTKGTTGDGHACAYCGQTQGWTTQATVTDDSGGSCVRICDSCRGFALSTRCGLCGKAKTGPHKADSVQFDEDGAVEICDECRSRMLHGRGDLR